VRDGLGFTAVLGAGFGILAGLAKGVAWSARRCPQTSSRDGLNS
jgi:hypothetical protein